MKVERIKTTLTEASTVQVPAHMPAWVVPLIKTALVLLDLALAFAAFAYAFKLRQGGSLVHTGADGVLAWTRAFASLRCAPGIGRAHSGDHTGLL